jgi:hypothetical protein
MQRKVEGWDCCCVRNFFYTQRNIWRSGYTNMQEPISVSSILARYYCATSWDEHIISSVTVTGSLAFM